LGAAFAIASAVLIFGVGALSLLASVWCRRTRDAVLITYFALFAGFVLASGAAAAGWSTPADALSPWNAVGREADGRWARLARFTAAWLVPALGCAALAWVRLRPAYARQLLRAARTERAGGRTREIPEHENPVAWRERRIVGLAPLDRLRAVPLWLAVPAVALASAAALAVPVLLRLRPGTDLAAALQNDGIAGVHAALRLSGINGWDVAGPQAGVALFVLTLLLAVRASGSITEEREQHTWDALLLTPLTTPQIVYGKFYGLLRAAFPYLLAYAVPTLPLALLIGSDAFALCVGVVGGLVVSGPWVAALGVYWSAYLQTSWRSLLATLGAYYGYLIVSSWLIVPACVVWAFVWGFCMLLLRALDPAIREVLPDADRLIAGLAFALTMVAFNAAIVGPLSWLLLTWAQARVEKRERAHVTRLQQEEMRRVLRLERVAAELEAERMHRE
jgi:hypothetical protein